MQCEVHLAMAGTYHCTAVLTYRYGLLNSMIKIIAGSDGDRVSVLPSNGDGIFVPDGMYNAVCRSSYYCNKSAVAYNTGRKYICSII